MRPPSVTTSRAQDDRHKIVVERKNEKIAMLQSLLEMQEQRSRPDFNYMKTLRYKLNAAKAQRKAMKL